ncbi:MAG TPA: vWA domain-containing protein [Polyangiaceae bacterium]|nr:vWA domain-containing protein [Polyangiaceae bacterium]
MLKVSRGLHPANARNMITRGLSLLACACALLGCSSSTNTGNGDGAGASSSSAGNGSGASASGSGAASSGTGNMPGVIFGGSGGAGNDVGGGASSGGDTATGICGSSDLSGCVGDRYAGEQIPLDIYVMFDVSCSMSCPAEETGPGLCCMGGPNPRIDQVRTAVTSFLNDPSSAGLGVGIGYFGFMQGGQTSCDPSKYSSPSVPIGSLPGNTAALTASLSAARPTGETPTGAAIRGACTYASQWQAMNSGHKTVVLLVTDGFPEAPTTSANGGCTPTIADAVQAATTCASHSPTLPVYVVGVGMQLTNLSDIAAAGGTKTPFLVGGADITQQIVDALNQIRALAQIPCHIKLPPPPAGTTLKLDQVNVGSCQSNNQGQIFTNVPQMSGCDAKSGGWYYDDPNAPQQIILCGPTCDAVNVPGVSLFASVGCQTQTVVR